MCKKIVVFIAVVMMVSTLFTGCLSNEQNPVKNEAEKQPTETAKQVENEQKEGKGNAASKGQIMKISIGLNEDHPEYKGMEKFEEIVESKTNNKYDIQLYANAQLGDDIKAMEGLRMNTLEMTIVTTSPLAGINPKFMAFDLPFIFPSEEIADKILDGPIGESLMDELTPKGLKGLGYWENGFRNLTNDVREVKTPEDVKGLKIRTMENPLHLKAWEALGANPTPMAFSEVFTAMQQGTIDGQENPIATIYLQKFHEVQKYTSLTKHVYSPFIFLISNQLWETMPEEDQKIFKDAVMEAGKYERELNRQMNSELIEKLRDEGMTVTELSSDQLSKFAELVRPVYDQFAGQIGKELIDEVVAATQE